MLGLISGIGGAWIFQQLQQPLESFKPVELSNTGKDTEEASFANNYEVGANIPAIDFIDASRISTQSVVYIKNVDRQKYAASWMDLFFGTESNTQVRVSSGSGVIFSDDGYIVTNNHVIEGADQIEVIYGKQTFEAQLIGVDPSSDLAVLKIEAEDLPAIPLGNSKNLKVGEWVIAVGNPFNLTSTVTAGIVSAKGRQINILQEKFPIESFIQTDAAINPGNSGGALVNKEGQLVGINTAILSRTGSYAGYGFAVPVDIVKKIFYDLVKYGEVQKAFFGGEVDDFNSSIAERFDIEAKDYKGVLVVFMQKEGAAQQGGLKEGDIINSINGFEVNSRAEFEEEIAHSSPGDKISVSYTRKNKSYTTELILTNREGTTGILKREIVSSKYLGADFEEVSKMEKSMLGIDTGIRVFDIGNGRLSGMEEGFIITHINQAPIPNAKKLIDILENIEGVIWIEGVTKEGKRVRYRFYGR